MDPPADHHNQRGVSGCVRVGVGVVVMNEQKQIYGGIRRSSHGSGKLALPGGHLEMYETWEECAVREVYEEMNIQLQVSDIEYLHVVNDIMKDDEKHYVTILMIATIPTKTLPMNMEPEKCVGWEAYRWIELIDRARKDPDGIFSPFLQLIQSKPSKLMNILDIEY